jgi:hypothetical protein
VAAQKADARTKGYVLGPEPVGHADARPSRRIRQGDGEGESCAGRVVGSTRAGVVASRVFGGHVDRADVRLELASVRRVEVKIKPPGLTVVSAAGDQEEGVAERCDVERRGGGRPETVTVDATAATVRDTGVEATCSEVLIDGSVAVVVKVVAGELIHTRWFRNRCITHDRDLAVANDDASSAADTFADDAGIAQAWIVFVRFAVAIVVESVADVVATIALGGVADRVAVRRA